MPIGARALPLPPAEEQEGGGREQRLYITAANSTTMKQGATRRAPQAGPTYIHTSCAGQRAGQELSISGHRR